MPITETDQFKYREEENNYRMELSLAEASEMVFLWVFAKPEMDGYLLQ